MGEDVIIDLCGSQLDVLTVEHVEEQHAIVQGHDYALPTDAENPTLADDQAPPEVDDELPTIAAPTVRDTRKKLSS